MVNLRLISHQLNHIGHDIKSFFLVNQSRDIAVVTFFQFIYLFYFISFTMMKSLNWHRWVFKSPSPLHPSSSFFLSTSCFQAIIPIPIFDNFKLISIHLSCCCLKHCFVYTLLLPPAPVNPHPSPLSPTSPFFFTPPTTWMQWR